MKKKPDPRVTAVNLHEGIITPIELRSKLVECRTRIVEIARVAWYRHGKEAKDQRREIIGRRKRRSAGSS